jgi:hypothetical protein
MVGPVTKEERNLESVLMRRVGVFPIPMGTRSIVVELQFAYTPCCGADGNADNLSLMIVSNPPAVAQPLNTELLKNRDFESGWAPNSPLLLNDPGSWTGFNTSNVTVDGYGGQNGTPPVSVSNGINGGNYLAGDAGGGARIRQTFDVTGNAAMINVGILALRLAGYFGGIGSDPDSAQLSATCLGANGATLAAATIGPVSALDRLNITNLLFRQTATAGILVPMGTKTIVVELQFNYFPCCGADGNADNLTAVLFNTQVGAAAFPGTNEDFILFTGVNGLPTTGPGHDIKSATGGDIITIRLDSFTGIFDYAPIIFGVNVRPTGMPLAGISNDIQLTPYNALAPLFIVIDGTQNAGVFGAQVLLPPANTYTFLMPHVLSGSTLRLQAVVIPGMTQPPYPMTLPTNLVYASTDAHELIVQ